MSGPPVEPKGGRRPGGCQEGPRSPGEELPPTCAQSWDLRASRAWSGAHQGRAGAGAGRAGPGGRGGWLTDLAVRVIGVAGCEERIMAILQRSAARACGTKELQFRCCVRPGRTCCRAGRLSRPHRGRVPPHPAGQGLRSPLASLLLWTWPLASSSSGGSPTKEAPSQTTSVTARFISLEPRTEVPASWGRGPHPGAFSSAMVRASDSGPKPSYIKAHLVRPRSPPDVPWPGRA